MGRFHYIVRSQGRHFLKLLIAIHVEGDIDRSFRDIARFDLLLRVMPVLKSQ